MTDAEAIAARLRGRARTHRTMSAAEEHYALTLVRDQYPDVFDHAARHVAELRKLDARRKEGAGRGR